MGRLRCLLLVMAGLEQSRNHMENTPRGRVEGPVVHQPACVLLNNTPTPRLPGLLKQSPLNCPQRHSITITRQQTLELPWDGEDTGPRGPHAPLKPSVSYLLDDTTLIFLSICARPFTL